MINPIILRSHKPVSENQIIDLVSESMRKVEMSTTIYKTGMNQVTLVSNRYLNPQSIKEYFIRKVNKL